MQQISLKALLEAGCHFGHKVERWHPKAKVFIYGEKEGVHIIDLVKTRDGLKEASEVIQKIALEGKNLLIVGTKRQARGVVSEAAKRSGMYYLTNRWVGGFLTNWEEVKKNIDKLNTMKKESSDGSWSQFPKHERIALEKEMRKLERVYGGVAALPKLPDAVFIVDMKKEANTVKEARKRGITTLALVDTNCDPTLIDYVIPANDDAVGSIKYIVDFVAAAFEDGKKVAEKEAVQKSVASNQQSVPKKEEMKEEGKEEVKKKIVKTVKKEEKTAETPPEAKPKKRGRPKKTSTKTQAPSSK